MLIKRKKGNRGTFASNFVHGLKFSLDAKKLDVEDQSGVRWDDAGGTLRAVRKVGGASQLGPLADGHLGDSLVPAADDLALADLELERRIAVTRRVELFAVGERAGVVNDDGLALLGVVGAVSGFEDFEINAHGFELLREVRRDFQKFEEPIDFLAADCNEKE